LDERRALLEDAQLAAVVQQEAQVVAVDVLLHVGEELDDVAAHVVKVRLEGRDDVDESCGRSTSLVRNSSRSETWEDRER